MGVYHILFIEGRVFTCAPSLSSSFHPSLSPSPALPPSLRPPLFFLCPPRPAEFPFPGSLSSRAVAERLGRFTEKYF